jgi:RND superfamily putative drug exporter
MRYRLIAIPLLMTSVSLGATSFVATQVFGFPGLDPSIPLLAFVFLVALGVDYNIFLMSRVREEAIVHSTREGVLRALTATGPVITSAGLILAGTFAVLMTLPLNVLFQVGFAVSVGVLVDTFVVRTLMVPAIVFLVGDASWWPSHPGGGKQAIAVSGVFKQLPLPPAAPPTGAPVVPQPPAAPTSGRQP